MDPTILLDAVVAVLLVVTIGYCWHLNRRLTNLRKGREELAALVENLNQVTMRAESSIGMLKTAAQEAKGGLETDIVAARELRDELKMITEMGNSMADRLEHRLTNTPRQDSGETVGLDAVRANKRAPSKDLDAAAREEILKAMKQAR